MDEDGNLISQYDADPLAGWLPTSEWEVGVVVPHTAVISLPPDTPHNITLVAGMYTWPEIVRLPAFAADGARFPNDLIPITTLQSE